MFQLSDDFPRLSLHASSFGTFAMVSIWSCAILVMHDRLNEGEDVR